MRRFLRRFPWMIALAILLLAGFFGHTYWFTWMGEYLVKSEYPVHADTIVVLAGDFNGNRVLTAAKLVRNGMAPSALISGPSGMYGLYECDLAIPFAVRLGFPQSYFVRFPNDSKSTASEALAIVSELRRLRVHTVDLVTSNYHTRRAGNIFRSVAPDIEFHVVAAPDPYFTPNGWWKNREGRKTFLLEWQKTIGSWVGM